MDSDPLGPRGVRTERVEAHAKGVVAAGPGGWEQRPHLKKEATCWPGGMGAAGHL
jgi:hypothetical protein